MPNYTPNSSKSKRVQTLTIQALHILEQVGIPLDSKSNRGLEKMALCFLAVAGIKTNWKEVTDKSNLKTRDIISFINQHFEENISPGSYDDIRRKDLKLLVLSGLILNSSSGKVSATNDPTRGYSIHSDFMKLILHYEENTWHEELNIFKKKNKSLSSKLNKERNLKKVPVRLPDGKPICLSFGEHNSLQKEIIESFLPRFGSDCEVLYIGDTSDKFLHIESKRLQEIGFFEISHNELPDVVAYSAKNNWLYLIEAVHSSGPMSETRVFELRKLLKNCLAELIFRGLTSKIRFYIL